MKLKPVLAVIVLLLGVTLYGILPLFLASPPETLKPFKLNDNPEADYMHLGQFAQAIDTIDGDPLGGGKYQVATLVGSPSTLLGMENPGNVVYVAAGISRDYRSEETNALVEFGRSGGKMVVADDSGYGNSIAQKFGIFYFGTDLWDLEDGRYDRNISLPLIPFVFAGLNYTIELNDPTGLTLIQNPAVATDVVAHCSEKCYADIDRSHTVNIGDKKGNISVIMRAQLQDNKTIDGIPQWVPTEGEAYFISDASIFSNEMMTLPKNLPPDQNGNEAFAKALIKTLLPNGGVVVIDDSRHLHEPGAQVVYSSFEAGAVATSRAELASLLVGGAALVSAIVVLRAKDRENWIHKFDLSRFHPRSQLPETAMVQVERLRHVASQKIQMTHSMSTEEWAAVPPDQMKAMIKDPMLIDLILNPGRPWAPEELRPAAEHIRVWGK
jgi:hypothetical protein